MQRFNPSTSSRLKLLFSSLAIATVSLPAIAASQSVINAGTLFADGGDHTEALQKAINSDASVVIIPKLENPWVLAPITLRGNLTLVFESEVEVVAKEGAFADLGASLFSARGAENLTIIGNGATLRMNREEYAKAELKGEWRHGIALFGCSNVYIQDLTIYGSGGDGFYVGSGRWTPPGVPSIEGFPNHCKNIVLRRVRSLENWRQGLSIISAVNVLVEDSLFADTKGAAPEAGIDVEPNNARELVQNIVFRNVLTRGNAGSGFDMQLQKFVGAKHEVSIRFENCHSEGDKSAAFSLRGPAGATPVGGLIEIVDCSAKNTGGAAVNLRAIAADGFRIRFVRSRFENVARRTDNAEFKRPIWLDIRQNQSLEQGNVEFLDCALVDDMNRPPVFFTRRGEGNEIGVRNVRGNIRVEGSGNTSISIPNGLRVQHDLQITAAQVD